MFDKFAADGQAKQEGRAATAERDQGRYFVQSLERGLAVIRAFGADSPMLTSSDVARKTGLTRAAARRFLLTLVDLSYVQTDGRLFRLTPRVLELGYAYLSGLELPDIALRPLEDLVAEVEEGSELAILDGEHIVYILRVPRPNGQLTVSVNIGTRMPAHATSMGRVLLAGLPDDELDAYLASAHLEKYLPRTITTPGELRIELERVRRDGYAIIDQELEEGLRAIAAPIRDRNGRVIASANLSTNAARRSIKSLKEELGPRLLLAVERIERDLHVSARPELV